MLFRGENNSVKICKAIICYQVWLRRAHCKLSWEKREGGTILSKPKNIKVFKFPD